MIPVSHSVLAFHHNNRVNEPIERRGLFGLKALEVFSPGLVGLNTLICGEAAHFGGNMWWSKIADLLALLQKEEWIRIPQSSSRECQ